MQKYQSTITATNGSVIRNVPVTVLKEDGSLAEIFMDREGQVQAPNPLVTDSRGVFYFYAKNGRYSLRTAADGVQITDADTVLLFDPDETVADGPIADAVRRAEDAAERAETALGDSGLQNMVQDAQDAAANAAQAVIDAHQAVASIDAALIEVSEAKEDAQAAAQTASTAASDAQAVKDSLLNYDGTLSATPEWSAVPAHEDSNLDAQTKAALNRIEKLKDDQQLKVGEVIEAEPSWDDVPKHKSEVFNAQAKALANRSEVLQKRTEGLLNVRAFIETPIDGVTSNQAGIEAAVAAAYAAGAELEWPAGTYVSTENIPNFHDVAHSGRGVLKVGGDIYFIQPKRITHQSVLFVDGTSGSDSNDGLNPSRAFKTIPRAFAVMQGPSVLPNMDNGSWKLKIAAGIYNEAAAWTRCANVKTWFEIEGDTSAPGLPATIIDGTGITANGGLYFQQGPAHIKLKNLKARYFTSGSVSSGFVFEGRGIERAWVEDCDGIGNHWAGLNADNIGQLIVTGGDWLSNINYQIRVRGNVGISIGAYSESNRVKVGSGTGVAIQVRDAATGHIDYTDFEDTATGLQVTNVSRVTLVNAAFRRCNIGWSAGGCSTVTHDTTTTFENVSLRFQLTQNAVFGQDSSTNEGGEGLEYSPFYDRYTIGKRKWSTTKNPSTASAHAWCASKTGAVDFNYLVPTGSSVRMMAGDDTEATKQYLHLDLPNSRMRSVIANTVCWTATQDLFVPGRDNAVSNGNASARWTQVFATNDTIITSDEREKQQWRDQSQAEKAAAIEIKSLIKAFKFSDAVNSKGESARWHFGVGAQTVGNILRSHGLDPSLYAFWCYDEWGEQPEVKDEEGNIVQEYRAAGNRYGIRYDELCMFILAAM